MLHFELSSEQNSIPPKSSISAEIPQTESNKSLNKEASTVPTSGGYLVKPSQIYEEEQPKTKSKIVEETTPLQMPVQADEPVIEMQLVVKDSLEATEETGTECTTSSAHHDVFCRGAANRGRNRRTKAPGNGTHCEVEEFIL